MTAGAPLVGEAPERGEACGLGLLGRLPSELDGVRVDDSGLRLAGGLLLLGLPGGRVDDLIRHGDGDVLKGADIASRVSRAQVGLVLEDEIRDRLGGLALRSLDLVVRGDALAVSLNVHVVRVVGRAVGHGRSDAVARLDLVSFRGSVPRLIVPVEAGVEDRVLVAHVVPGKNGLDEGATTACGLDAKPPTRGVGPELDLGLRGNNP
mmetsp:Transcript_1942/g.5362  ORF Transcript_1942/g.5362 Transcript_1942/m.5362 type:complete len:207 (-) Transcript_1942:49-669(-)